MIILIFINKYLLELYKHNAIVIRVVDLSGPQLLHVRALHAELERLRWVLHIFGHYALISNRGAKIPYGFDLFAPLSSNFIGCRLYNTHGVFHIVWLSFTLFGYTSLFPVVGLH